MLIPFSWLYSIGLHFKYAIYRFGIYKRVQFDLPVIAIGNLSTGGTGKTPMTEYILSLAGSNEIATLSRGYGRSTKGFLVAETGSSADEVGDEPLQLKIKFPNNPICVSENRILGIPEILTLFPETKAVILDDAYQHLRLKAGKYILLTSFTNPYFQDRLLPTGNLRESRMESKRADIIVVTKCPASISAETQSTILDSINPAKKQIVFFSTLDYGTPYLAWDPSIKKEIKSREVALLVTAIADSKPILRYLFEKVKKVDHIRFSDHYRFTEKDCDKMIKAFKTLGIKEKKLITTEKDASRLQPYFDKFMDAGCFLYCLPVKMRILNNEQEFHRILKAYIQPR